MGENRFSCGSPSLPHASGCKDTCKDTVCIETHRMLDSCRDRDCFENVKVFLTELGQDIIDRTNQVRAKDACIAWTYIGIDPVQFNRGFYAITIRFYIKVIFEGCICPGRSQEFDGIAVLEKQVVLWGGESNVSIFRSSGDGSAFCAEPEPCYKEHSVPTAVVEVVEPIVLGVKVLEPVTHEPICCCCCACDVPSGIAACLSAPLCGADQDGCGGNGGGDSHEGRCLVVSLGLFSLVRLIRPAQYLIHATEFIIPDKECVANNPADPCELFRAMAFPVGEFAPPPMPCPPPHNDGGKGHCGCGGGRDSHGRD